MCVIWQQLWEHRAELIVLYFTHTFIQSSGYSMTDLCYTHKHTPSLSYTQRGGLIRSHLQIGFDQQTQRPSPRCLTYLHSPSHVAVFESGRDARRSARASELQSGEVIDYALLLHCFHRNSAGNGLTSFATCRTAPHHSWPSNPHWYAFKFSAVSASGLYPEKESQG